MSNKFQKKKVKPETYNVKIGADAQNDIGVEISFDDDRVLY
jgi:hypothetical protein